MRKINKKDFFTIPNLLCYLRILLIPVFIAVYLKAVTPADFFYAGLIIIFSGLTDLLDGFIARRFNQITQLGKFLDPFADKLTQGALVFCLTTRFSNVWILVILFVVKEGFMAIMGLIMLRHNGRKLDGAMWFGKVCTAALYAALIAFLVFPSIPLWLSNTIVALCAGVMIVTLLLYIPIFSRMWRKKST